MPRSKSPSIMDLDYHLRRHGIRFERGREQSKDHDHVSVDLELESISDDDDDDDIVIVNEIERPKKSDGNRPSADLDISNATSLPSDRASVDDETEKVTNEEHTSVLINLRCDEDIIEVGERVGNGNTRDRQRNISSSSIELPLPPDVENVRSRSTPVDEEVFYAAEDTFQEKHNMTPGEGCLRWKSGSVSNVVPGIPIAISSSSKLLSNNIPVVDFETDPHHSGYPRKRNSSTQEREHDLHSVTPHHSTKKSRPSLERSKSSIEREAGIQSRGSMIINPVKGTLGIEKGSNDVEEGEQEAHSTRWPRDQSHSRRKSIGETYSEVQQSSGQLGPKEQHVVSHLEKDNAEWNEHQEETDQRRRGSWELEQPRNKHRDNSSRHVNEELVQRQRGRTERCDRSGNAYCNIAGQHERSLSDNRRRRESNERHRNEFGAHQNKRESNSSRNGEQSVNNRAFLKKRQSHHSTHEKRQGWSRDGRYQQPYNYNGYRGRGRDGWHGRGPRGRNQTQSRQNHNNFSRNESFSSSSWQESEKEKENKAGNASEALNMTMNSTYHDHGARISDEVLRQSSLPVSPSHPLQVNSPVIKTKELRHPSAQTHQDAATCTTTFKPGIIKPIETSHSASATRNKENPAQSMGKPNRSVSFEQETIIGNNINKPVSHSSASSNVTKSSNERSQFKETLSIGKSAQEVAEIIKTCVDCGNRRFATRQKATRHLKDRHNKKFCFVCFETISIKGNKLKNHYLENHARNPQEETARCCMCLDWFAFDGIYQHMSKVHLKPMEKRKDSKKNGNGSGKHETKEFHRNPRLSGNHQYPNQKYNEDSNIDRRNRNESGSQRYAPTTSHHQNHITISSNHCRRSDNTKGSQYNSRNSQRYRELSPNVGNERRNNDVEHNLANAPRNHSNTFRIPKKNQN